MFTRERLQERLDIDAPTADRILAIVRGTVNPEDVSTDTAQWIAQCYHRPSSVELKMRALNQILGGHGCEPIWSERSERQPAAEYVNTGDSYATTILYDYQAHTFRLTSWGDFVETYERRYRLK